MNIISMDNGTSGSIAVYFEINNSYLFMPTPIRYEQSYTKKKQEISRVDYPKLYQLFYSYRSSNAEIYIERPCVNPGRFKTTLSAMRSLEATLICIETLSMNSPTIIDSKQWQKIMLPGVKGSKELKKASAELGCQLFPDFKDSITLHGDADALLILEWVKRSKK